MPRILVVEDESQIRAQLVRSLQRNRANIIEEAGDGEVAVEKVKSFHPDVVLLDLRLPKMDGMKVLEAIKSWDSEIQVVILTGHGNKDDAIDSLNLHAFRFLQKPFNISDIEKAVKEASSAHFENIGISTTEYPLVNDQKSPDLESVRKALGTIPLEKISDKKE